jgi:hypothetical protein
MGDRVWVLVWQEIPFVFWSQYSECISMSIA